MGGIRGLAPRNLQARWELLIPDEDDSVWLVGEYETSLWRDANESARRSLPDLIRDAAGPPPGATRFDPAWRSSSAVSLAREAYAAHDFGVLPVLADALEEAGCDDPVVLSHCRSPGEHCRGCWVVDLVLGRAGAAESRAAPDPAA